MPKPKIFISHSTKTSKTQTFLNAIYNALKVDFEVLLDRTGLVAGDDWRQKIYDWIDQAHGAVLLLSKESLVSDFVRIEASILSWRACREHQFKLVPVIIGKVQRRDLLRGIYGNLALTAIQCIIGQNNPDKLAQKVVECFKELRKISLPRTPKEILEEAVISCLKDGLVNTEVIGLAAEQVLGLDISKWGSRTDYYQKFSQYLLSSDLKTASKAVHFLADYGMNNDAAKRLFDIAAPVWVNMDAARPIIEVAQGLQVKRAVSLNAIAPLTASMYVRRASCRPPERCWNIFMLSGKCFGNDLAEIKREILQEFEAMNACKGTDTETMFRLALQHHEQNKQPVFVVFPPERIIDQKLMASLKNEFPTITFFILTGRSQSAYMNEIMKMSYFLKPELIPEIEQESLGCYFSTMMDLAPRN